MGWLRKTIVVAIAAVVIWQLYSIEETYRVGAYLDDQFMITHRGEMIDRPEQTMAAYEYAYDEGIRIMECDARLTKDDVFIAMHDSTWDRTTNGSGSIEHTDWYGYGEWLDAGGWFDAEYADEPVPAMANLLDWAHSNAVLLWIDCYFSGANDTQFQELIDEHDMAGRVVLQFVVETRDFHRAEVYDDIEISYRVALPLTQLVTSAIGWASEDGVKYLTIPWEMGQGYIYDEATENDVNIILFAYNQYKTDTQYITEFQEGAWGCFTDSAVQAGYIQKILEA